MTQFIPGNIIKKVKYLEIKTRRTVNSLLSGGYHSAFKGKGMEFSEVRAYVPGDDIRAIDWNVTAKSGYPFIKVFHEERELTVILVVDASASLKLGTRIATKSEIAAEMSALLSFSAIKNNDNVGLAIYSDGFEKYIPPKKGKKHAMRVIQEVLYFSPRHKATNIKAALDRLNKTVKKKSLIFILSDFIDSDWKQSLSILNKKHDVIPVVINDVMEQSLPDIGLIELYDEEKDELLVVDTSDRKFAATFKKDREEAQRNLDKLFRTINVEPIFICSTGSYVESLMRYFRYREKRR
ncbi:MAG: DUF58 domain-containing protein [Candidatus Margulisiibacteriota bacterium]|nr:MAG: hypothetical protein A2X43_06645 [Candidatus Margulisbacteria bacterium GWD2_39_127]OGI05302.1 MAG: hypothetical protein A2X42_03840 [Candidatus Margulisbacteria bacterium GWF2_38_17]OGI10839.1 MAG: hypothetical protein A2X41_05635 [Candidatus Margulisbacteria bacterium GWE2_39_32]PZM83525.1 MAG: DUF58 domain-containing protein [Candidatus Margulisiibacteriota bacterium]HAR64298.1 DUF58 domain-containing protein [Candidatus Margulisiibacteriota bacterium]